MVDQLRSFGSEVTRVAREVGTEGKLGGQASVPGVAGTWKDLTDSVNSMASNLTSQVRGIANVVTSVANGDLSKKFVVEAKGEIASLADTINSLTDTLRVFSDQVITVAREVGTEGKLGGQAKIPGVSGTWKDLTDSVNYMASNLTGQVRNIALVTTAVANGDLSQKITVDVEGEMLELKNTVNAMVDQLRSFAAEVTRVAKDVGTEGKLGGQAEVQGVAGTWRELTDSVNGMASNLTGQVRNIALVTTAVANGDLSQKITVDVKGEMQELKTTINTMVDQLRSFAAEVTRVAREVGTDGKLGGQADVPGVAGTWKDLTDNVNSMATNLTTQVRNIALVTTAVANGDLSRKITVDVRGEILELKDTMNIMVDQLRSFAAEVTRVAKEVGTEGRLGGQADVPGVAGTWKDLTDNVNSMAQGLTGQVRNIALVTTAVANGDLSKKITINAEGEILELKNTINTMVDQLRSFAAEVTRVAKEVGTEGKLGAQAAVPGVAGTWKDLTDSVNTMAASLTDQVRNIALVTTAVANGDLSRKITVDVRGEILELKDTINTMVDQLRSFAAEVTRVAKEVGTEGKLGGQAYVPGVAGTWRDLTDNVNSMASNLTNQVRGIARVVTSVANGDLSRKFVVEAKGEIAELADTINSMTETLGIFAEQVTTVAREVGTEGRLGGQARVPGVAGTWKDLTDSVNSMASNLTTQVRGIVKVVTAVANGDLRQKLVMETKGEIAALADTINSMTDTLRVFADQVTGVAREVGIEGKLGGQAKVPGASGTWRDLTDNVNQLAGNLTAQVRAIADVATAVTEGDLTRSISVEAQGELLALKDNVNQMITNLRETTQKNQEQDWLKTNLAKFGGMMQGQKNLEAVSRLIMSELTPLVSAHHGAFFIADESHHTHHGRGGNGTRRRQRPQSVFQRGKTLRLIASYAYKERKNVANTFRLGEGLVGQSALEKEAILLTNVPPDYIQINSGLGEAEPLNVLVLPILFEDDTRAVVELASFQPFSDIHRDLPRAAVGEHRRRPQHDRREHAHRGAADSVAAARQRAADAVCRAAGAAGGAAALELGARGAGAVAQAVRGAAEGSAGGAPADQRGAGGEGDAAGRAESRRRAQEPRGGERAAGARGEGGAAGAQLSLQERVPRQHEPRAAHAAQQPAHPGQAAGRQQDRQPLGQAGRVRAHHPGVGHRSAQPDQRGARPVQGRGGEDRDLPDRCTDGRGAGVLRAELPRGRAAEGAGLRRDHRAGRAAEPAHRRAAAAADPAQPAGQRLQVHRERARSS